MAGSTMDAIVARMNEELDLKGLVLGVVRAGEAPLIRCFGGLSESMYFRAGSVTKTVTALAAMQLVEEGALGLDEEVAEIVECPVEQPFAGPPIRVRHLITHTSGIGELPSARSLRRPFRALGGVPRGLPLRSVSEVLVDGVQADAPPEQKWAYSNPAYNLLGLVVEARRGGQPFEDVLDERVFQPLGMDATVRVTDEVRARLAPAFHPLFGRLRSAPTIDILAVPAGGMFITPPGLARYASWLLTGEPTAVLSSSGHTALFEPRYFRHPSLSRVATAFWLPPWDEYAVAGHDGTVPGFSTSLKVCREAGLAVFALANRTILPAGRFGCGHITDQLLADELGIDRTPPSSEAVHSAARPGTFRPSPGWNTNSRTRGFLGGEVRISSRGDRLELSSKRGWLVGPLPLRPIGADLFEITFRRFAMRVAFDADALHIDGTPCPFTLYRV